ncbi:MAG: Asp-tRNA(Asn)/Glu-tRNA(Gln) amidotransferase subunit GatB, partial [Tissierella sp.]|nr:Asp-tRNA(Asn)/Glu-tRNA(Gln) amidotransferase subunit GatB [Tissierella sp.]
MPKEYEIVMGLEVHVELKTKTKIFCGCTTEFGGDPNSHCCPVCIGLPGALPVLNEEVVNFAIKAGLATNCEITRCGKQDRKHYFYPDLATSYQVSQDDLPICHNGHLDIEVKGAKKSIGITRIHIEEDAGKLIHREGVGTLVDYNRAGVPLIEIVSEPDLRSAEEVKAYLQKLRAIMQYIDVSDCKMNEGSFRCDVNLSVREKGAAEYGTRAEIKNLNSFQSIMRAIEYESSRQIKEINDGGVLIQETRGFDQTSGKTYSMREKEDAEDYRYLPDPDLMPIVIDDERIKALRNSLPELPDTRKSNYMKKYGLSSYDAEQLITSRDVANYFEDAA